VREWGGFSRLAATREIGKEQSKDLTKRKPFRHLMAQESSFKGGEYRLWRSATLRHEPWKEKKKKSVFKSALHQQLRARFRPTLFKGCTSETVGVRCQAGGGQVRTQRAPRGFTRQQQYGEAEENVLGKSAIFGTVIEISVWVKNPRRRLYLCTGDKKGID